MGKKKIPEEGIYDARELGAGRMFVLGFQHMFAMFGATVLVPILTGLDVSTTLLFAGLGTLLFHLITGGKVPGVPRLVLRVPRRLRSDRSHDRRTGSAQYRKCSPTHASALRARVLCT